MKNISIISAFIILFLFRNGYSQYTKNYAGNFNGSSSYIAVPGDSFIEPQTQITLEAWINPSVISANGMAIIGKNFQSSYFLALNSAGRVEFGPKGGNIFRSKVSSIISVNKWTHIAGTYNGMVTKLYINGILDTQTTAISGQIGANSDSLFIGADRIGNTPALFFNGKLDNVRIWRTVLTQGRIADLMFLPLDHYIPSGIYSSLSACFQLDNDVVSYSNFSYGHPKNLTFIDYRDKPVNHMDYNSSLVLDGSSDEFIASNLPGYNATTAITLEAWIRRDTTGSQPLIQNIVNKSNFPDRTNYSLKLDQARISFSINSPGGPPALISTTAITNGQWNHVAATYNSATGYAIIYLNGVYVTSTIFAGHPLIQNQSDNLHIGAVAHLQSQERFKGQIDGVRIWKHERTYSEIRDNRFRSLNNESDLISFDFDEFANLPCSSGAPIFTISNSFAGQAHLSSSHLYKKSEPTSPILSGKSGGLDSTFVKNDKSFFIPDGNITGIRDSIFISTNAIVSNLKAYVLLSHSHLNDIVINLISPSGTSVQLHHNKGGSGDDIMTVYSDAADSSAASYSNFDGPGTTPPYSPGIKPEHPLSAFNGENQAGWWKMQFIDPVPEDVGYLHSWGIASARISYKTLSLTSLIQGFYNSTTNTMIRDTLRVFLRKSNPPYNFIDSSKSYPGPLGYSNYIFNNVPAGQSFYIVVRHRNSIETWSSAPRSFTTDTLAYNFASAASKAYGANQIQLDESPVKFGIYSGDINQDGNVDVLDLSIGNNDAFNFVTGYVPSDVTGDNVTDALDQAVIFNNALNFVGKITPP